MAGPGRELGLFLPALRFSVGPGRKLGLFLPALRFSAGPGRKSGIFLPALRFSVGPGRKLGLFLPTLVGWMVFSGGGSSAGRGGVFCWVAGGFLESGVLQGEKRAPLG